MSIFSKIHRLLPPWATPSPLDDSDVQSLEACHPTLPKEYFIFLKEIGFGDLGAIHMYGGLVEASEIYRPGTGRLDHVLLFGDDGQGYSFGFDLEDGNRVVEVTPDSAVERTYANDFSSFIEVLFKDCFGGQFEQS